MSDDPVKNALREMARAFLANDHSPSATEALTEAVALLDDENTPEDVQFDTLDDDSAFHPFDDNASRKD